MSHIGSRCKVMHGNADKTSGGLTKEDLMYNKQGKIVSIKMSKNAKKEKRLEKAGWTVHKGQFGAIPMKGGVNTLFNNSGSPIKKQKTVNNTKIPKYIPGTIDFIKNQEKIRAIEIATTTMRYNFQNCTQIGERLRESPANAIFIDETANKVYKIGSWTPFYDRSIDNECKAYNILMEEYPEDINIHYPKMFKCEKIEGTDFGILTIQFIENIIMKNPINNDMRYTINEYLSRVGIRHNDLNQNVFIHQPSSNKPPTFLIIDFEDVTFINKTSNKEQERGSGLFGYNSNNN